MLFPIRLHDLLDYMTLKNPPVVLSSEKRTPAPGVVRFHFLSPSLHKLFTAEAAAGSTWQDVS